MPIRVAIPIPHSVDLNYSQRAMPQYENALSLVGGEPVRIPLDQSVAEVAAILKTCDAVLLPGSPADVDPAKFGQSRSEQTAASDPRREKVDRLLLDDAYAQEKPVLGICYGLQSLNVYRHGSLVQHIPDFLPTETRGKVDHAVGKKRAIAHTVEIERDSSLARVVGSSQSAGHNDNREGHEFTRAKSDEKSSAALAAEGTLLVPVNSSHHQSADAIGDGLRIVARCPDDGVIEALEGTSPDRFVLAVQWHPERSVNDDEVSRAIFKALLDAAR